MLEANADNPIVKAFSNIWTKVGEGASKFFTETSGTGLGGIIKTGIEKAGTLIKGLGSSNGVLGTIATTVKTGISSIGPCLLYTSPSPRDGLLSRMPSSA